MIFKNILVVYKKSAYRIYFENKASSFHGMKNAFYKSEIKKFKKSHDAHYNTLNYVTSTLRSCDISFTENYRGRTLDYSKYDLIITVGGDGTFLETARKINNQTILGVNSAPSFSVGNYCVATKVNFEKLLKNIISNKFKIKEMHRLNVSFENKKESQLFLNDLLICHANPAALYRYSIKLNQKNEEQRSSGLWVSTASGSSAAIKSAGGQPLSPYVKKFQYKPRELHQGLFPTYELKGKILQKNDVLKITTLVRKGNVYFDGAHHKVVLDYGDTLTIKMVNKPIRTIVL